MFRNKSASVHQFAMVPKARVPRSRFHMPQAAKDTFDAGDLIPFMVEECIPGDSWHTKVTGFVRMATPIFPVMDNLHLDVQFFFVPNRLLWVNWEKLMGEQANPADSIAYTVPTITSPASGFTVGSLADHMGIPTVGQIAGGATHTVNALPFRAYAMIWNEWYRVQDIQNSVTVSTADGPDTTTSTAVLKRNKRHDYFTSCLPWTQKGGVATAVTMSGRSDIKSDATGAPNTDLAYYNTVQAMVAKLSSGTPTYLQSTGTAGIAANTLYTDGSGLSITVNAIRQSEAIQRLLECDARGGTRYGEMLRAHFGVTPADARLQRPEYLGGGSAVIQINPIAQTSATGISGGTTPAGTLAAMGTGLIKGAGFNYNVTEHGYIIGVCSVRADLTYQQGLRRHWNRSARFDFPFPEFVNLGEQAVYNREIYLRGDANDALVFGYVPRYDECRYAPNEIRGLFRSTAAGTLDPWHLAQKFTALPTLNTTFITEDPPVDRVLAVTSGGKEFLADWYIDNTVARPLPMYGIPSLTARF